MNDDVGQVPPGYRPAAHRPGSSQPPPPYPGGPVAQKPAKRRSGTGKAAYFAVMLAFAAVSVGMFMYFFSQRDRVSALIENGVETTADVGAITTTTRRGRVTNYRLLLSFEPAGAPAPVSASVATCGDDRYTPGSSTVDVVYVPNDPEVVELAGCAGTGGTGPFPLILGVAFAIGALLMLINMFRPI